MKKLFYAACAAASIIACTKAETPVTEEGAVELTQQGSAKQITLMANIPGTKASFSELEDGSIKPAWVANDAITVFTDGSSLSTFTASEDGESAAFSGSVAVSARDSLFAVYPSTSDFVYDFSDQGGTLESAAAIYPMYGATVYEEDAEVSKISEINFHNAATIVRVKVTVPSAMDVKYLFISTSDNSLVNKAKMDKYGNWSECEKGDIKVTFDTPQSVEDGGVLTAYVAVVPHTTSSSLCVSVYDENYENKEEQKGYFVNTASTEVTFEKGKVQGLTKELTGYVGVDKHIDTKVRIWKVINEGVTKTIAADSSGVRYLVNALKSMSGTVDLILPDETAISNFAFIYKAGSQFKAAVALKSITAPNVTSVGQNAFWISGSNASKLETVDMPNVETVGKQAFFCCKKLTSIDFPKCTSIGEDGFNQCEKLPSVNFPALVSVGSSAFYQCKAFTKIELPALTSVGANAFSYCTALTSISLPALEKTSYYTFSSCKSLVDVDLPVCTNLINYTFQYCEALQSVSFPKVTSISLGVFSNCTSLTKLQFDSVITFCPDKDTTKSSSAFYKDDTESIELYLAKGQTQQSSKPTLNQSAKTFATCTFKSITLQ